MKTHKTKQQKRKMQLPAYFKPERYVLTLEPAIETATFSGEEVLHYTLAKSTKRITLHAVDLSLSDVCVVAGNHTFKPKHVAYSKKAGTVTFSFAHVIPKGKGRVYLSFCGTLNDRMHGFYRSRYTHEGHERFLATTQFEATDARRAFPCIDEPAAKAVFEVTIVAPEEYSVISNTVEKAIIKHERKAGHKAVTFTPTPRMSTYLLAFIVGDFEHIEGKTKQGVTVRVFVTPGKKEQARFALKTAISCLEFYNRYFAIPYPLPILDLIAIPDFAAGAMENWGAVTYRESTLLFDEDHSSLSNKQRVAIVIAHELAHQWFGNLVTMRWWTDLWLNEGFASYMEYMAVDHIFPEWDIWTQFVSIDMSTALRLDALYHTHPIEVPVHHPAEIDEIFDAVSYSKGASIIRMLANYLGEKHFRNGLRLYLKTHAHQNADTKDLWEALEQVSGAPVRQLMQNWTGKGGYPLIKVHPGKNGLAVRQERFFMSPHAKQNVRDNTKWTVPITARVQHQAKRSRLLLEKKTGTLPQPRNGWIKINPEETGFYRVDYAPSLLADLRTPIAEHTLPPSDRLALIRDAFALAEAGESSTVDALTLLTSYTNETEYTVWTEIATGLGALRKILHGTNAYPDFERFCRQLILPAATRTGWTLKRNEPHSTRLLRGLLLNQLITYGHEPTTTRAQKLFNKTRVPADIRSVAYHAFAKRGGVREHATLVRMYKEATNQQEQTRIAQVLGAFEKPELLEKTLAFTFSKHVRPQDTLTPFHAVWGNPLGRNPGWKALKQHWNKLVDRHTIDSRLLGYFIMPTSLFVTEKDARAVKTFFKKTNLPSNNRTLAQSLEKIYANTAWKQRDLPAIKRWLSEEIE